MSDKDKNNEIYVIAKSLNSILVVNKVDIPFINSPRAMEVKAILISLDFPKINDIYGLQYHLKHAPWEEVDNEQNIFYLNQIYSKFSDRDIIHKIILPLVKNRLINEN